MVGRYDEPQIDTTKAGTVTNYSSDDKKCKGQSYSAGQGFIDSGKDKVGTAPTPPSLAVRDVRNRGHRRC